MGGTVLVTGGAGYVGSHIAVELARAGYALVVLDSLVNGSPAVLPVLRRLTPRGKFSPTQQTGVVTVISSSMSCVLKLQRTA